MTWNKQIVIFLSTKTVDAVFSCFCIFKSIQSWTYPLKFGYVPIPWFRFFFSFFFQPEGFRLFMWKAVAKLNMACFNSRITFTRQVEKKIKNEGKPSPIYILSSPWNFFFLLCKDKKILKKNRQWPVDAVLK